MVHAYTNAHFTHTDAHIRYLVATPYSHCWIIYAACCVIPRAVVAIERVIVRTNKVRVALNVGIHSLVHWVQVHMPSLSTCMYEMVRLEHIQIHIRCENLKEINTRHVTKMNNDIVNRDVIFQELNLPVSPVKFVCILTAISLTVEN